MKKLINDPANVVREELEGMEAAHPDLIRVSYDPFTIVRKDAPVQGKVALVSGGGSGHEPMHGGFVGMGMLDAACPGEVFTSPTPDQMEAATKAVDGGAGVIHIVKNYTGDVMNFEMAAELCRSEGTEVESVLVDDDVAVQDSLYTAGRRGVGATVLLEKIAGAAAEEKRPLKEVVDICREVNANARTMGMALTSCTVPAAGKPTFELGDDEMEIGIGIHGEPGRRRGVEDVADQCERGRRDDGGPDEREPVRMAAVHPDERRGRAREMQGEVGEPEEHRDAGNRLERFLHAVLDVDAGALLERDDLGGVPHRLPHVLPGRASDDLVEAVEHGQGGELVEPRVRS